MRCGRVRTRLLGETEVGHLDVTLHVEQQILRLEVSVDDLAVVQVLKGGDDDSRVKGSHRLLKVALLTEEREELAALHELEQHVQRVAILPPPTAPQPEPTCPSPPSLRSPDLQPRALRLPPRALAWQLLGHKQRASALSVGPPQRSHTARSHRPYELRPVPRARR